MRLTEDRAKAWLRQRGFSLPQGGVATTPDEAADLAAELGGQGGSFVGRRGDTALGLALIHV